MGWIKNRIDKEYKKHRKLDWSLIAEKKILSQLKFNICSFCNPKTMCKKHKIEKVKILAEIKAELNEPVEVQKG